MDLEKEGEVEIQHSDSKNVNKENLEATRERSSKVTMLQVKDEAAFAEIWTEVIAGTSEIPRGDKLFLRACKVYKGANGEFVIKGPSEDIIQTIREERFAPVIERQIKKIYKENVEIVYETENIEVKEVHKTQPQQERLDALIEKEPSLQRALDELNLELLD